MKKKVRESKTPQIREVRESKYPQMKKAMKAIFHQMRKADGEQRPPKKGKDRWSNNHHNEEGKGEQKKKE